VSRAAKGADCKSARFVSDINAASENWHYSPSQSINDLEAVSERERRARASTNDQFHSDGAEPRPWEWAVIIVASLIAGALALARRCWQRWRGCQ
jgi:hypothetical protein